LANPNQHEWIVVVIVVAMINKHVTRFDVAMHDSMRMQGIQSYQEMTEVIANVIVR